MNLESKVEDTDFVQIISKVLLGLNTVKIYEIVQREAEEVQRRPKRSVAHAMLMRVC